MHVLLPAPGEPYTADTPQRDPFEMQNIYTTDQERPFEFSQNPLASKANSGPEFAFDFPSVSGSTAEQANNSTANTTSIVHLLARLDTLLMLLKTCKGRECTNPWDVLHPSGDVTGLHGALNSEYDSFYEQEQERVKFTKCEKGYILESEGPRGVKRLSIEDVGVRGGTRWSDLV